MVLERFLHGSLSLHAPDLIRCEVGNALGRRAPHPARHYDEFLALSLQWHPADDALLRRAQVLQIERHIIFFDAIYLALAERLHFPLLTDDRDLVRAARGAAIPLSSYKPAR